MSIRKERTGAVLVVGSGIAGIQAQEAKQLFIYRLSAGAGCTGTDLPQYKLYPVFPLPTRVTDSSYETRRLADRFTWK
jgi:hypothetical protein